MISTVKKKNAKQLVFFLLCKNKHFHTSLAAFLFKGISEMFINLEFFRLERLVNKISKKVFFNKMY